MKILSSVIVLALLAASSSIPAFAASGAAAGPVTCSDGTPWPKGGSGACRGHGGIAKGAVAAKAAPDMPATPAAAPASAAAPVVKAPPAAPIAADAGVRCKDGTMSAKSGRGACSGHGGQEKATVAAPSLPAAAAVRPAMPVATAAPAPAPAISVVPAAAPVTRVAAVPAARVVAPSSKTGVSAEAAGATAKCKDGSFSHTANHTGACSRHGGVAQWLDNKP